MSGADVDALAAVIDSALAHHQYRFYGMAADCSCGRWSITADEAPDGDDAQYRAHLAAELAAVLETTTDAAPPP